MSKEYTKEEMRERFLNQVRSAITYWSTTKLDPEYDNVKYRCEGVAFSIMNILDSGMLIIPAPHPEDKQYHIDNGEDYYPNPTQEMFDADIGGGLHEEI